MNPASFEPLDTAGALRLIIDADRVLAGAADADAALEAAARLAVPTLAAGCWIETPHDEDRLHRRAAAHADPEVDGHLARGLVHSPPDEAPCMRMLRSREPLRLAAPVSFDSLAVSPDERDALATTEPGAVLLLPLLAGEETLGVLTLIEPRPFTGEADGVDIASAFAARVAHALAAARLYTSVQHANNAKTEFLSMISHEFRTPLSAIMGYTDLLEAEYAGPLTAKQKQQLDRIRTSAWHLLHLIEEILTFLRTDTGHEELRARRVDVTDIIRQAAAVVEPLARERSIGFTVQTARHEIETDPGKLRQILVNLLTNAVKYTDRGEIRLELGIEPDWTEFRVHDTGIGIEPEHLERIFEPFWQVDQSATRRASGTGLGLSVVRRLARILGGDVRVHSTPGKGSSFVVRMPAHAPSAGPSVMR